MILLNLKKNKKFFTTDYSGSILIFTLWIILMLSLLALGLAYKSKVEIKTVSYELDELKTHYITKAATNWMFKKLKAEFKGYDTETDFDKYIVDTQNLGEGKFSISNIKDEERKININKIPEEILIKIVNIEVAKKIINRRPFYNIQTLLLFDEVDETELKRLQNNWLTVYGTGKINFNTTRYDVIKTLEGLLEINISNLEHKICEELDKEFSCCQSVANIKDIVTLSKNSIFKALQIIKEGEFFFRNVTLIEDKINTADNVKTTEDEIENMLYTGLYDCCDLSYVGPDKNSYCKNWAIDESESIRDTLFDYIIDTVLEYLDVKSDNYKVDIIGEVQGVQRSVTAVLERFSDNIKYWYYHYYLEYE